VRTKSAAESRSPIDGTRHKCYTGYMIQSLEIPDPFATFVARKYANFKGAKYDFFSGEWDMKCGCCSEPLNAPTKKILTKIRLYHTRNECLGGY
jgi:hypothetical protein